MILQKCSLSKMIVLFSMWKRENGIKENEKTLADEKQNKTWLLLKVGVTSGMH